jgi:hypothetical protein
MRSPLIPLRISWNLLQNVMMALQSHVDCCEHCQKGKLLLGTMIWSATWGPQTNRTRDT